MKGKTNQPITESFFTKKLTETIQDLKGFMVQNFATKFDLKELKSEFGVLKGDIEGVKVEIRDMRKNMDERFEQVDKRFDEVDKRFDEVDERFENIDKRFDDVDSSLAILVNDSQDTKVKFGDHEERIKTLEHRKN